MDNENPVKNRPIRTLWETVMLYLVVNYKHFEKNLTVYMSPNELIVLINKLIVKVDKLGSWNSRDRFSESLVLKEFLGKILIQEQTFEAIFHPYNGNNTTNEALNYIFTRTKVMSYGGRYFRTIAIKNSLENAAFYNSYAKLIEKNDNVVVGKLFRRTQFQDILSYLQYVRIIFNFALFLIYTGNYEIALNILQITRGTFAILATSNSHIPCPKFIMNKILLFQKHCLNLVFIAANNIRNLQVAQQILNLGIEEYDDAYEKDEEEFQEEG